MTSIGLIETRRFFMDEWDIEGLWVWHPDYKNFVAAEYGGEISIVVEPNYAAFHKTIYFPCLYRGVPIVIWKS